MLFNPLGFNPFGLGFDDQAEFEIGAAAREVEERKRRLSAGLVVFMISSVVKLIAGLWLHPNLFFWIYNSLHPLLTSLAGIWLLSHVSDLFSKMRRCLMAISCLSCLEQDCEGGGQCLCLWSFFNLLGALIAFLPFGGSDLMIMVHGVKDLIHFRNQDVKFTVSLSIFLVGTLCAFFAQAFGAFCGCSAWSRVMQQSLEREDTMQPPDFQNIGTQMTAGQFQGRNVSDRSFFLPVGNTLNLRPQARNRNAPVQRPFIVFGGRAHRLGDVFWQRDGGLGPTDYFHP